MRSNVDGKKKSDEEAKKKIGGKRTFAFSNWRGLNKVGEVGIF
jgi:hypothetical protein